MRKKEIEFVARRAKTSESLDLEDERVNVRRDCQKKPRTSKNFSNFDLKLSFGD